jgi:hypothetical protein
MHAWSRAVACATRDTAPWSVIVQDDAEPLPGWADHLSRATASSPSPVLGLTHFGWYGEVPLRHLAPYGVGPYLLWGGAIAYRRDVVEPLARWCLTVYAATGYPHDDCLVAAWCLKEGIDTALCARAIFGQPIRASLLNHHTKYRSPATTIANTDGPDWSSGRTWPVKRQTFPDIYELARRGTEAMV